MKIILYLLCFSIFGGSIFAALSALNNYIAKKEARNIPQKIQDKLSLSSSHQLLTLDERQKYSKTNSRTGFLYLIFIAVFDLIISIIITKDAATSLVFIIPITVIIILLIIRDHLRVINHNSIYKTTAYVLSCSYGRYGFCTFIYYDYVSKSFIAKKKPTPIFAEKRRTIHHGDFIDVITKQTTHSVRFVDFLSR